MFLIIFSGFTLSVITYNSLPFLWYLCRKYLFGSNPSVPQIRAKQVDPSTPYSPWVKVRSSTFRPTEEHVLVAECSTVTQLFNKVIDKYSDKNCFGYRQVFDVKEEKQANGRTVRKLALGEYRWKTYKQVDKQIQEVLIGFQRIGIETKDVVMIYADTRLEWMVSCQALFRLGAIVGTLYTNLGEDAIIHAINETEVSHLITNTELLSKLSPLLEKLPHIRCIICINDGHQKDPNFNQTLSDSLKQKIKIYSFQQIEDLGKKSNEDSFEEMNVHQSGDDTAVLMYTSGSTGVPKGVLISHKNLLLAIRAFYEVAGVLTEKDMYCAFLPLAHILEICAELCFISIGVPVGYASVHSLTDKSLGLQKGVKGDLTTLKPTVIAAVPLILDRIKKGITDELTKKPKIVKTSIDFLLKYKRFWTKRGFNTPIINILLCRKFKGLLGGRIRFIASGGAYLRPQTHEFVRNLFDVIVVQGYGLTETSASATITDFDDFGVGHVGAPVVGVQIKLNDWPEGGYKVTDKPNPRGELVIGGDNVSNGYYKNAVLTEDYFKLENGIKWFATGDIGEVLPSGVIKIIDRKKDIIKLANGEYVSLSKIEEELKLNPIVDNVCVYGNQCTNFLIALIVPNMKALQKLAQNGVPADVEKKSLKELCNDSNVNNKVFEAIKKFCSNTKLLRIEIPAKIKLCSEEWLPDNGLVTSSFKLKRKAIEEFYWKDIKQMYGTENNNPKVS